MKKTQKNPNHIAVIMDGNGTWSKRKGLSKKKGHQKGVKSAKNFTTYSLFILSRTSPNKSILS